MRILHPVWGLLLPLVLVAVPDARADVRHDVGRVPVLGTDVRGALVALDAGAARASLTMTQRDRFGDGDVIVRFEQTHMGLPVIHRGATLRVDSAQVAREALVDLEDALPASVTPTLSAARAAEIAQRFTVLPTSARDAHLVIVPTPAGAKLAYAVVPPMIAGIPSAPRVLVDAHTGAALEARDLVVFANKANVYDTNPQTSMLTVRDLPMPIEDQAGHLGNAFVLTQNCVDNKTVKTISFGPFMVPVHVCDLVQLATADQNGDFLLQPLDDPKDPGSRSDPFSEVSMYFHAAKAYRFFRELQGDPGAQVVADKPFRTISNLQLPAGIQQGDFMSAGDPNKPLEPFQNAFFSPAGGSLGMIFQTLYGFNAGAMWFGQGPNRDYSYDGDVVYHELTHAVVDQTLKLGGWHLDKFGVIDSPGAMNEGLADYFSSALTGDAKVGEYASKDFNAARDAIRNIDNADTCLDTIVGEVHVDSTFFSGALWSVRKSLSPAEQKRLDQAVYKTMRMNPGSGDLGFETLGELIVGTLKTDFPAAAPALEAELKKRGVLPMCERIFPWTGKLIYPAKKDQPPFYAGPGTASILGKPELAPGIFQVKVDFAEPVVRVAVELNQYITSGGGAFGSMGKPFTPKILVKFDQPIAWTTKGKITHDADLTLDCVGDGGKMIQKFTAELDVPPGATSAYLQIANAGDNDGNYGDIQLTMTPAPPMEQDAGADGGTPPAPATIGCNCTTGPGTDSSPWASVLGVAAVAALLRRRRVC